MSVVGGDGATTLASQLIFLELRSARLEGLLAADTGLARMWRSQAALTEACRSVALEDIPIFEGDVISHRLENRLTHMETARGVETATALLRVLCAPGDPVADPVAALERCWRAGGSVELGDEAPEIAALAGTVFGGLAGRDAIFPAALRASCRFRLATGAMAPAVERLVFMTVDHALRGGRSPLRGDVDPAFRFADESIASDGVGRASWCLLPAAALSGDGVRAWAPAGQGGLGDLLAGLAREVDRALGAVPVLRRWRETSLQKCAGLHGRSRLRDLVLYLVASPVSSAAAAAHGIGVTERAARTLMSQAEDAGIVARITGRQTYRVWAVPHVAERLRMRSSRPKEARRDGRARRDAARAEDVGRIEETMDDLDAAMGNVDRILGRYRHPDD